MTEGQTISWIFLAIAIASETEPTRINGISLIADGINHAVPTQKELQVSIKWLTNHDLVIKEGRKYKLTNKGKLEYASASERSNTMMTIWENLELKFKIGSKEAG